MALRLRLTAILMVPVCAAACGGSRTGAGTDGGIGPDDVDAGAEDGNEIAFRVLLSGFDPRRGFVHEPSNRIFSLPDALASSLGHVTVAEIDGSDVNVRSLTVRGAVPTGRIESLAYAPGIDRFVAIVRAHDPHRIEVATIELGADEATFSMLSQPNPVQADGYQFGALYPRSGATLVVERGNEVLPLTIGETEATWGAAGSPGHFFRATGSPVALDLPRGQLVGFGVDVYNPETMEIEFQSTIGTLSLSGPYQWTELQLDNAPDSPSGNWVELWAAWDATEQRLLTVVPMDSDCGGEPCVISSLWEANLPQGQWTQLREYFYPPSGFEVPFAIDDVGRRALGHTDGAIWALSMSGEMPLETVSLEQTGDIGPSYPSAATVLADGRILSSDGGVFRILDPGSDAPHWEPFGSDPLGAQRRWRPSFVEDPNSGEILIYGGAASNASPPLAALWSLSSDGETFVEIPAVDGPGGRTSHGAAVVGTRLIIVGGYDAAGASSSEVWSFERQDSTWSKVTDLPVSISGVSVRVVSESEIRVIGRRDDTYAVEVFRVDLGNGVADRLSVDGAAPEMLWSVAPYDSCFIGFESGDTVDSTKPQSWRCVDTDEGIRWEAAPMDFDDYMLGGSTSLLGTARPDGSRAYFVGRSLLEVAPDK